MFSTNCFCQVPTAPSYVDLHGQINQPITKSPLLMSCYANHMTQLQCSNWLLPAPALAADRATAAATGAVWIPRFVYVSKGFAPELMVDRFAGKLPAGWSSPTPTGTSESNKKQFSADSAKSGSSSDAGMLFPLILCFVKKLFNSSRDCLL